MSHLMFDPPTYEIDADHGPLEVRVAIVMMLLSLIGVCLRFYAKRITRQLYSWDDWLIIPALLTSWGVCIVYILAVRNGNLGRHMAFLKSPEPLSSSLKSLKILLYTQTIIYLFSLAFTKYSVSIFYRRLFQIRKTRTVLTFLEWFLGLRLIAILVVAIIPCRPITSYWDMNQRGKCVDTDVFLATLAVTNVLTYLLLLGYPMPIVWNLQVVRAQKIGLLIVFVLGGFVVVVSCLRLAAIIQLIGNHDTTWALFPLALWTTVELNIAVFCACIPIMRPLLYLFPGHHQQGHHHHQQARTRNENGAHSTWWQGLSRPKSDMDDFRMLEGDSAERNLDAYRFQTRITAEGVKIQELGEGEGEGIRVESTVAWA